MVPSPVLTKSLQIMCPEVSPPNIQPFLVSILLTYLSPTSARINLYPSLVIPSSKPRLLMCVPTTPDHGPILLGFAKANIYKRSSPSNIFPLRSIIITLSPSPSRDIPKSALCLITSF